MARLVARQTRLPCLFPFFSSSFFKKEKGRGGEGRMDLKEKNTHSWWSGKGAEGEKRNSGRRQVRRPAATASFLYSSIPCSSPPIFLRVRESGKGGKMKEGGGRDALSAGKPHISLQASPSSRAPSLRDRNTFVVYFPPSYTISG